MGVAQYAHEHGRWEFTHPRANHFGEVPLPEHWRGDGIICRLTSPRLERAIGHSGVPAVNVSWLGDHSPQIIKVVSDEKACGEMVASYFLERHFQNAGYVGFPPGNAYQQTIQSSIREKLGESGISLDVFKYPRTSDTEHPVLDEHLSRWIGAQTLPLALIVWDSILGRRLTTICQKQGLEIPRDVSIVCLEHDDLVSALSSVPLANLDQDPWRVGYLAASHLHRLMDGGSPPDRPVLVAPVSVIQRRSSESSAVRDVVVRRAYQFIHDHVAEGYNVDDIVRELGVPRRTLEQKFHEAIGMTPGQLIRRARLQVAKRLLRESTLTVSQIAERSGFGHPDGLHRTFKRETGQTPTQFRRARS